MRTVSASIYTLGCKVNSYESIAISERLRENGIEILKSSEKVDICIINTCAVTSEAERKSRQIVRRMASHSSGAYIIVTGCSAQADAEKMLSIEGVSAVCGNREKMKAADLAIAHAKKLWEGEGEKRDPVICSCDLENAPFEKMQINKSERTRAVIKIEDGCESKCAYCIIPSLRGKIRSKDLFDVVREAKALAENGYREIVLTGIEVSAYGKDLGIKDGLASLIEELDKIEGVERIRLGSLDPSSIKSDFIDRVAKVPSFAPHFHLSLQSGCDRTLFSMKRRYNVEMVRKAFDEIRAKIEDATFTSDIIVGFPGETDEDFCKTREFLKSLSLLSMHVFAYSKRPGTPAAMMENQVSPEKKTERMRSLESLRGEMTASILDTCVGKELEIIVEEYKGGKIAFGHTANFIEAAIENAPSDLSGKAVRLLAERHENGVVYGKII